MAKNEQAYFKDDDPNSWRNKLHEVIFEADTPAGKLFDVILLWAILLSVTAVMLESVKSYNILFGKFFRIVEWVFTIAFTLEYIARTISVKKPLNYTFSFFGIIDLLAIIPTYLSLIFTGTHILLVIRGIRLLRIFRIFKLARYIRESRVIILALKASRYKITVFIGTVLTLAMIMGALMYMIEGERNGFTSIPRSIYWAIVTLTTVGYGDIAPQTVLGQVLASFIMIMGYSIIAVPTGIITVELAQAGQKTVSTQVCRNCTREGHDVDAIHCKFCGAPL
jgi:voltage-gated potassium channel